MGQVDELPGLFRNVAASTTEHHSNVLRSSIHQLPILHPLNPMRSNQDVCPSFLQISSNFSSVLASALVQHSAAHAAARFATTFWPYSNVEASQYPPADTLGDSPTRQTNSGPSLPEIAGATVAAATAWWAAHGLLPLCTPLNSGYTCSPAFSISTPMEKNEARTTYNRRAVNTPNPVLKDQQLDLKYAEALQEQHLGSKSPPLSSSDSAEGEDGKLSTGLSVTDPEQAEAATALHDSDKMKGRKPVDRSSCGSNTPSSSEVETDALKKHGKGNEESNEPDVSHIAGDPSNRRGRICSNLNESWKEVSEGGRLAFQALFSREILPQSFSSPNGHQKNYFEKDNQHTHEREQASQFDLNTKACGTCSSHQLVENNVSLRSKNNEGEGVLTMGFGYVKLKARRTGFKPYKRCSVEDKESRVSCNTNEDEVKAIKRRRLEGGSST